MANYPKDNAEYLKQIKTDILPRQYNIKGMRRTHTGLYILDDSSSVDWNTGAIQDSLNEGVGYQKFVPYYMGVKSSEGKYEPVYVRCWDGRDALNNIVVSSALNMYPTPLQAYGVAKVDSLGYTKVGAATIDLNNLEHPETKKTVKSIRLDKLLLLLGKHRDIESWSDFQHLLTDSKIFDYLTPRAVVQLGLCSLFIPNAIGETDANSRNIILLADPETGKFDVVVRIDAEANTYLNDMNNQRSGKKQVPKGIYRPNETMDEYQKNISDRGIDIDWELFGGFVGLTQILTSRREIDMAVTEACLTNSVSCMPPQANSYYTFMRRETSPVCAAYDDKAFYNFSDASINRAKRFLDATANALGRVPSVPPFAEGSKAYRHALDAKQWQKLVQKQLNKDGKEIGE